MSGSPPSNEDIARHFDELAELLDVDGADRHRILAYRRAAVRVRGVDEPVVDLARAGRATELPDIGSTLQSKIVELADTGAIAALGRLRDRTPAGLREIARLDGVGGARARAIMEALGADDLDTVRAAVAAGRLAEVRGIGSSLQASIARQLGVPSPGIGSE